MSKYLKCIQGFLMACMTQNWKWRRLVIAMAMVVVFVTTYALILPAISLEKEKGRTEQGVYLDQMERGSTASLQHDPSRTDSDQDVEGETPLSTGDAEEEWTSSDRTGEDRESMPTKTEGEVLIDQDDQKTFTSDSPEENHSEADQKSQNPDSSDHTAGYASGIYTGKGDGYTLSLELTEEMKLPADVSVSVEELQEDASIDTNNSAVYSSYMRAVRRVAAREGRGELSSVRFLKFALFSNGKEIRPSQDIDLLVVPMEKDKVRNGEKTHVFAFRGPYAYMIENVAEKISGYRVSAYRFFYSSAVNNRNWGLLGLAVTKSKTEETTEGKEEETAVSTEETAASTEETEASTEETAASTEETTASTGETEASTEETTEETRKSAEKLEFKGQDYKVVMTCDDKAGIPEGAVLQAAEIPKDSKEYKEYLQEARETLEINKKANATARFFDIKIMDREKEIEPSASVSVNITYDQPMVVGEGEKVSVLHFGEKKTEVLDDVKFRTNKNDDVKSITFEADSFSVYGMVGTTMEKNVLASDGHNYRITVTCGADTGIPRDADLEVTEITEGSSAYGRNYKEYVTNTENVLGLDKGIAEYIRLFDIKIVDGTGEKIQPAEGSKVDVKIELADAVSSDLSIVHFPDESLDGDVITDADILSAEDEKGIIVSFKTSGFSAYAIVAGPEEGIGDNSSVKTLSDVANAASAGECLYLSVKRDGNNEEYFTSTPKNNNVLEVSADIDQAAKWVLEPAEGENAYYIRTAEGKYIRQKTNNNDVELTNNKGSASVFIMEQPEANSGRFTIKLSTENRWLQYSRSGQGIRLYTDADNTNNSHVHISLVNPPEIESDPYDLHNKSYGLMNWNGGAAGKALMNNVTGNSLDAKMLTVMSTANNSSQLFVPNDSEISMWKFHWINNDNYYLTTDVNGSTKYLKIDANGLSLVSEADDNCKIQVIPGTGVHTREISLKSGDTTLTYSGSVDSGFSVGGSAGTEWLKFVELSNLTSDYFLTYSASKVSVSDETITNGSRVIVYTRSWNEEKKQYDFYAIGSDGTLVPVYENGDSIEWVSGQINKLLWNFVEYYWENTTDPNYYYELYNQYSEKYIAPQVTGSQILSADAIGINLNGRRDGKYYSTILAWDETNYSYVGLKVEDGRIVPCPKNEAMDFYFAVMEDLNVDDNTHTVDTVNHTQYGITMKVIDLENDNTLNGDMNKFLGSKEGGAVTTLVQGLLSTDLKDDGYPMATKEGGESLGSLYNGAKEVNHLFIESTYHSSGYFEYDSTQNFASLDGNNFKVYKELGTYDASSKPTLKHGQFFPFNDLAAGVFATVNDQNLYTISAATPLPDGDPRKYERLYSIENNGKKADCYFALELEAGFTQTPSGKDAWGHDIIFEFTGDDDFWLYVDGELVIDLGGIHSAVPGKVNFRTGEVNVNGTQTTLRELFYQNYKKRGHTDAEAQAYVDSKFVLNSEGQYVFEDFSNHTMKIFYMERGAGASNLQMRFNLAAVKKGTVQLSKELSGVDKAESIRAEFPYQIYYMENGVEKRLTNSLPEDPDSQISPQTEDFVYYQGTKNPVKYQKSLNIDGIVYEDVFFLKPGEAADINFPEGVTEYKIIECGINTNVYDSVTVNGTEIEGTSVPGTQNRKDYGIDYNTTDNRARVNYVNNVNPDALKTITITKKLYKEDGETEIDYGDDQTPFTFRLYLASEFEDLATVNMHTYHVKNPQGYYCLWDPAQQKFVLIGDGISDYADLTEEEKNASSVNFTTSGYGSIGKIPAGYTVEIRDVLVGTQYRVEERPWEIPDGYSFQKYDEYPSDARLVTRDEVSGVEGTIVAGAAANHHVDVCNLRGWGLRMNKIWRDENYMSDRAPTYFAVFTHETDDGELTMVPDTLRRLNYTVNPQTLYWYFLPLPVDVPFSNYEIREVTVSGEPDVDADEVVTNAEQLTVTPIKENGELKTSGKQKGESQTSEFTYSVHYDKGVIPDDANVRVDTVTNDRPGIILKKEDWKGQPLSGATFTLKDSDGNEIGTFTSDENGQITTAFLSENKNYTLTEVSAPQAYYGLERPMTISSNNGNITVRGVDAAYYTLAQAQGTNLATLIIKDRPRTFQAVKKDGDTGTPMDGVTFALHRQVTVDGTTTIDTNPMPGYERLVTNENGVIPKIDNTLPANVYELRETTPDGYRPFSQHEKIRFRVSETGEITMISTDQEPTPQGVTLTRTEAEDGSGTISYLLTILNYRQTEITLQKEDEKGIPLKGAKFQLCKHGSTWEVIEKYSDIDMTEKSSVVFENLAAGRYRLTEVQAPDGYVILSKYVYFTVEFDNTSGTVQVRLTDEAGTGPAVDSSATVVGTKITVKNTSGTALPSTGGPGSKLIYLLGIMLTGIAGAGLLMKKRRNAV